MLGKTFEHTIRFHHAQTPTGQDVWLPLIEAVLIQGSGNRVSLPLMFDTGASVTTLRDDLYHLLGVQSWDAGQPLYVDTGGGPRPVRAYQYQSTLEIFGTRLQCPINLQQMPHHPLYLGLLGREQVFEAFGFGFWEKTHELYVTLNP